MIMCRREQNNVSSGGCGTVSNDRTVQEDQLTSETFTYTQIEVSNLTMRK